jgi:outer membrane protein
VAYGKASSSDFGEIISGNVEPHDKDLKVTGIDGGYLLKENLFDVPLDLYLKGGLSYFDDSSVDGKDNPIEATLYIKVYWNLDFLNNRVRIGFGEGASYTSSILYTEYQEAEEKNDNNSNYLNYIDVSIDFDIGKLTTYKPLYGTYIGWALKHRSGIFGLINNVRKGGSNYNTIFLERNF